MRFVIRQPIRFRDIAVDISRQNKIQNPACERGFGFGQTFLEIKMAEKVRFETENKHNLGLAFSKSIQSCYTEYYTVIFYSLGIFELYQHLGGYLL